MPRTEAFERYSEAYDEWFQKHADLYESEIAAIRPFIPRDREGMEVGVGSGKFAAPFGIRIGVEPSEKMAARARVLGIDVYPGVAETLPFSDERFEFVLMVTTVCFVDDVPASFREAFRVLKSGGCIIVGLVDRESDLGGRYEANRDSSRLYNDAVFYSVKEILRYLEGASFGSQEMKQTLVPGKAPGTVLDGSGKGAFVAIKGVKPDSAI